MNNAFARTTDPITSHLAAASLDGIRLSAIEKSILSILQLPMNDEDLVLAYQEAMNLGAVPHSSPSGIRTRRNHLHMKGRVRIMGINKTASGRSARVWIAND
jgi:hypothetical protein